MTESATLPFRVIIERTLHSVAQFKAAVDLFENARSAGVDEFVNAGRCSLYGRTEEEINEKIDCDPESRMLWRSSSTNRDF